MDTKELQTLIGNKAVTEAREVLVQAGQQHRRAVNLGGLSEVLQVNSCAGEEVFINTNEIYEGFVDSLIKTREKRIREKAVEDFLTKFEQFSDYLRYLAGEVN